MSSPYTYLLPEIEEEASSDLLPYNLEEDIPEGIPVPLEVPTVAAPPPPQETALDVYLREREERLALERANTEALQAQRQRVQDYLQAPDLEQKLTGEDDIPEGVLLNETGQELLGRVQTARDAIGAARQKEFEKDFGWLGAERLPGWSKYRDWHYTPEQWEELSPEKKAKAFDIYTNRARNYYVNYGKADPDNFETGIQDVLIKNQDLVNANISSIQNKLDSSGYGRGWKDTTIRGLDTVSFGLLPARDNPGYESMSASIAGAAALDKVKTYTGLLGKLNTFDNIFNPDGSINQSRYASALKSLTDSQNEEIVDSQDAGRIQEIQSEQAILAELGQDPQTKVQQALEAVRGYSRIGQLEMTKASPELAEGLSGKRILPSPLGKKDDTLPAGERIRKILSNPLDFANFTLGMMLAQQADLLEENLTSSGIGVITGQPYLGIAGTALAAGQQEATLTAADIVQDELRKKGYNPEDFNDWQRAYDAGVVSEIAASAARTGQTKGLTTAAVESGLENIFSAVLRRVPFFGPAGAGLARASGRFGKALALHGAAGFTSAAAGEAAGQAAAYGTVDPAEVFIEGASEIAGTGTLAAQKAGIRSASQRLRGERPQPTVRPAAPVVEPTQTQQQSVADEQAELEREIQQTAPPESDTGDAQEDSTEIPAEPGDVQARGEEGVVESAPKSATEILKERGYEVDRYTPAEEALSTVEYFTAEDSANAIERLILTEEAIRQSPQGMEGLRQDLIQQSQQEAEMDLSDVDVQIQQALAEQPTRVNDFVALAKRINEPLPTVEGIDMQNLERIARSASLGETALSQELREYSQEERTKIGKALELDDISPQGLSKGMRARIGRQTGGFLDVGLVIDGLQEAAVKAWSTAKDSASWSADMVKQFGDKVVPVLKDLWNKVTAFVRKAYDVIVDPPIRGRNTERGMVGFNNPELGFSPSLREELQHKLDVFNDSKEDDSEAFSLSETLIELIQDSESKDNVAYEFKKELEDIGIKYGVFKAHTKEQLDNIVVTGGKGRKKYDFKRGDKYYIFDKWDGLSVLDKGPSLASRRPNRDTQRGAVDLRQGNTRGTITKAIEQAGAKVSKALSEVVKRINFAFLNRDQQRQVVADIEALGEEFAEARKAGIDPDKSRELLDKGLRILNDVRTITWTKEFDNLKAKFPLSLKDKGPHDFQSGREALAYVATNGVDTDKESLRKREEGRQEGRDKLNEKQREEAKKNADEAKTKIGFVFKSPEYQALSPDNKRQVIKATKYLFNTDTEENSAQKNEGIVAAINNLIEGEFIGAGKFASLQRVNEFTADLASLERKYGGSIPFFDKNYTRQLLESFVAGGKTSALFKKEARLRAVGFSHPELRRLWDKHFGNYLEKVQTENSQLQQATTERLFEILKKYGFAKKKFLGKLKDRTVWEDKANPSLRRMQVASMVTTWRQDSTDPIQDINEIITDVEKGIQNEKKGNFLGAQGQANENAFYSILGPAIQDGLVIQTDRGFQVEATPEVWHQYVMDQLTENERKALEETRGLAAFFEPGLKFVSEFYYGKEWNPWQNYMPRTAYGTKTERETIAPELTATTAQPTPEGVALPTHGSVLHPRQRLGAGQYYGMDLSSVLHNSLNTAAYEVTTAETRFAIEEALKSDVTDPFFGNNEDRKIRFHNTLKSIHQAELHQGTGLKQPGSAPEAFVQEVVNTVSNSWLALTLGRLRQYPAQYLTPFIGAFTMVGPKMFDYASQFNSKEWTKEQRKKFYNDAFPDLLQRKEQIDPFFDRSASRNVLDALADLSLSSDPSTFTTGQKALVVSARIKRAVAASLEEIPKTISRSVTNLPDYRAVQTVFPILLQDSLIKNGIISKADEFTPENIERIQTDTRYPAVLAEAKTAVSDVMGNANRFSLRPDIFVFRGEKNPLTHAIYTLMQTVTQYAGDRMVDFKDMSYVNERDPLAGKIRADAAKRMGSSVLQALVFKGLAGLVGHGVLKAIALGLGSAEGLDEEEKKILAKVNRIRLAMLNQTTRDQALKELLQMAGGPLLTNSLGGTAMDVAYANSIVKIFTSELDEEKEALRKQIKATKNQTKKTDLELRLDEIIKYQQILGIQEGKKGFSLGPVVNEALRFVQDKKMSNSEADVIADQYWKSLGQPAKATRNPAVRLAAWAGSFASGDIRDAQREINKARTLVARARQVQLDEQARNQKRKVDTINLSGIR